ncbi:MAG: ester cyclase [Acidobacteriales bacterium]|nr:ester cyclase [Candidatus Koribacter versatilis]MBI3645703.1 ester cyclase [Terriglobales bacterium]
MRKLCNYAVISGLVLLISIASDAKTNPTEANKAVARKLFEVALNQGKWDVFEEIHAQDFMAHGGTRPENLKEDLESAKGWRQAFPDGLYTVDQVIAEGDLVVVRWTGRGTNTGEGNGLPATGKHVESTGITIFRIVKGKIAEEWNEVNMLGLLRQLGLLPAARQ